MLGLLGRGGMGVVYKAHHLRLKRVVAVKMILAGGHAGPDELARFQTEAQAIARLQHPNIVQVFEVGEHGKLPYFSLEFCGGGSLAKKLGGKPLPPAEAAALVETLAKAMQAAHEQHVIHRDLKPANVLLAEDGTPKITDFGLAKQLDVAGQTTSGAGMGTPSYMAPEQAGGKTKVGPLADVYALGAILYECLTGRPPFLAATPMDIVLQVLTDDPVPPRRLNPAVPRDLETICVKCLQKDSGKRYASAAALAEDLRRFLTNQPILARPAGAGERVAKWCRRNPRVAVLSGSIALVVVAWAVTASLLYGQAEASRKVAQKNELLVKQKQMTAIGHVLGVGKSWLAWGLQQPPAPQGKAPPESLRESILRKVRKDLGEMADQMDLSPFNRVSVHQLTGDFARDIGLLHEARADYQRADELVEPITRQEPRNDVARANMAVIRRLQGNLAWELDGDVETARKDFDKARELRQEIADHPRSGEYSGLQNSVALAYIALDRGRLEFSQGNLTAAREHLARALEARRAWVKTVAVEDQAMAPSYLSEACLWMGVVLAHQGDQEGADKLLQEGLELSNGLAKKDPKDLTFQKDLAEIHGACGDVQALRGDWPGAFDSYKQAREYVKAAKLPARPEDAPRQLVLARTIECLAVAEENKGLVADALGHRRTSLMLREELTRIEPACVSWQAARLLALAHMDRLDDAEAAAAELTPRAAGNSELLLQLARYHAIRAGKAAAPAQRRAAAEQALTLLGDAVKTGYADRLTLVGDPDLAPLRQEADYKTLVEKMPSAAAPGK